MVYIPRPECLERNRIDLVAKMDLRDAMAALAKNLIRIHAAAVRVLKIHAERDVLRLSVPQDVPELPCLVGHFRGVMVNSQLQAFAGERLSKFVKQSSLCGQLLIG